MKPFLIENLESRTLFAGVTLLATGRLGGTNGWEQSLANAITAKLGGPSQVPEYVLSVNADPMTGNLVPGINHVAGTGTPQTSSSGQIIVLVDYFNISADSSYQTTNIGGVIANYLMTTPVDGVLLTQLPIHEVGVSRGTGIMDQISNVLGQAGIWVDQETNLDPNPIAAQGDPPTAIYDNVAFVDNYWRNDGSASQINDGHFVDGAYNLNLTWIDANSAGYVTPHLAPAGYYIGTIDQTATQDGDGPINSTWYGNTPLMPARNATGYIYTDLVGAPRPLSGVWAPSGGTGVRTATVQQGIQWGNITDLAVTTGNKVASGASIAASYLYEDRDSADTVTFYLDTDRNPYNGNFSNALSSTTLAQVAAPTAETATLSTAGIDPGTYFLVAKVTDPQGNTRYDYSSVAAPLNVLADSGPNATLAASTVTVLGAPKQQFTVTYVGSQNVVAATLGNTNITVTGPNGYSQSAQLVSTGLTDGPTITATYSVNAPNAGWAYVDNGVYKVTLNGSQVADALGATAQARQLGSFLVSVPGIGSVVATVVNSPSTTGTVGATPLAGQEVFLDLNGSNSPVGNPTGITDANGQVRFDNVVVGTYRIGVLLPQGWVMTTDLQDVSVTAAQTANAPLIGEHALPAAITGRVFNDANGNGIADAGETGLAGVTVYLDLNLTGSYQPGDPTAVTDASGNYTFVNAPIGSAFAIREGVPAGRRETTGPTGTVTLQANQTLSPAAFGSTSASNLSGSVVFTTASSTLSLAGFEVILTQHPKRGKSTRLITFTQADGSYSFGGLVSPATDTIQIVRRKGFRLAPHARSAFTVKLTSPAQAISNLVFSETPIVPVVHTARKK